MINIYATPPSNADIAALRAQDAPEETGPPDLFRAVFGGLGFFTTVAAAGIGGASRQTRLADVAGAAARDWSASWVAHRYVEKVRAMGRELVLEEVTALEKQVHVEGATRSAVSSAAKAALASVAEASAQMIESASRSVVDALRQNGRGKPVTSTEPKTSAPQHDATGTDPRPASQKTTATSAADPR